MIGAQSGSICTDGCGSEPMVGDESEGPMTQTSLEAKSVFGSIATECAASVEGVGVKTGGSQVGGPELCV